MKRLTDEQCELMQLRKEKIASLCDSIKLRVKYSGEDLGKVKDEIIELLEIQERRIKAFKSLFEKQKC